MSAERINTFLKIHLGITRNWNGTAVVLCSMKLILFSVCMFSLAKCAHFVVCIFSTIWQSHFDMKNQKNRIFQQEVKRIECSFCRKMRNGNLLKRYPFRISRCLSIHTNNIAKQNVEMKQTLKWKMHEMKMNILKFCRKKINCVGEENTSSLGIFHNV